MKLSLAKHIPEEEPRPNLEIIIDLHHGKWGTLGRYG